MRRVRVYDNTGTPNETADNFTIVFITPIYKGFARPFVVASCSKNPFHPQGVAGSSEVSHLYNDEDCRECFGKRISVNKLPEKVRQYINQF